MFDDLSRDDSGPPVGVSLVHTNKTVARLRQAGIATWAGGRLHVTDPDRLAVTAGLTGQMEERRPIL